MAQAPPVRDGDQFQVNTYTADSQRRTAVSSAANGDFVVLWDSRGSNGTDTDLFSIQGQRYASNGSPIGGEFQANAYTTSDQRAPSVAVAPDGSFITTWHSNRSSGTDTGLSSSIQLRRFASDGSPVGDEFQVNTYTTAYQSWSSVAMATDGDFVIVWESRGSSGTDTSYSSIQGQQFSADASQIGQEFQINTYTTFYQRSPSVAMAPDGDSFVVVWANPGIRGQRYASDGSPLGGEFVISQYPSNFPRHAHVAMSSDGDFAVVWDGGGSSGTDNSSTSIQGRRYASDGSPLDDEFQVNTYTTSHQSFAVISMAPDGDFVVVWQSHGANSSDVSFSSAQGQRYALDGSTIGGQFQINTYTTGHQTYPFVSVALDKDFVIVWESIGSGGTDTETRSIQGQMFCGTCLFADGFESGDATSWSSSSP